MLRQLSNKHLHPVLYGFRVNTTTPTVLIGQNQVSSVVRNSPGDVTITFKRPFSRKPVVVANGDQTGGAVLMREGLITATSIRITNKTSAGGTVDGVLDILVFGYMSSDTSLYGNQGVKTNFLDGRLIAGSFSSVGAIVEPITLVNVAKTATGTYTVTEKKGAAFSPITVAGAALNSAARHTTLSAVSTNSTTTIKSTDTTPTDTDQSQYFIMLSSSYRDPATENVRPLLVGGRRMRVIACTVAYTAGVPAVVIGAEDITSCSDDATGTFTLTFKKPFARTHIAAVASSEGDAAVITCNVIAGSASTCQVKTWDLAGAAIDPSNATSPIHVLIVGSDDATASY